MPTLYINLSDQLGNQVYAYMSAKSLAERLGFDFRFTITKAVKANSTDKKRGRTIKAILADQSELIEEIPHGLSVWSEPQKRKLNYCPELERLTESTVIEGHLTSYKYLSPNIRKWFKLDIELEDYAREVVYNAKRATRTETLYAVHYRCGFERRRLWGVVAPEFYRQAKREIKIKEPGAGFLLFSDDIVAAERLLGSDWAHPGPFPTLFQDFAAMMHCDGFILGNSSFAITAAMLSGIEGSKIVRPAKFYGVYGLSYPDDIYPADSLSLPSKRLIPEIELVPRIAAGVVIKNWLGGQRAKPGPKVS